MKRVVYTVFVDFEDETGSLQEKGFIEELRRDIERGVDKEGWCGDVNFVEIRDVKEEREVQLDADHQGELIVKLQEVIQEGVNQSRFNLELLTRITENKATNVDLEYIDCL